MPFKPKINIKLVKCASCGKSYNNPLNHVCIVRASRSPQAKAARRKTAAKRGRR